MLQSKISFSYLNCASSFLFWFFFFFCDSIFSPWTCGLEMRWLWVLCFYVSLFYYYHRGHCHYYYYHLFWRGFFLSAHSPWLVESSSKKSMKSKEKQHFSDFSWASLLFACGWDWALPARGRAVQPPHIIPLPIFRLCALPSRVKAKMGEDGKPKRGENDSLDYFLHFKYNPWILANVSIQSGSKPHVFIFIYAT